MLYTKLGGIPIGPVLTNLIPSSVLQLFLILAGEMVERQGSQHSFQKN